MDFLTSAIFSFSIFIGGIAGGIRFRKLDPSFLPFLFYLWAGCLNEVVSLLFSYNGYSNVVNTNLFLLGEVLVICYQFRRWRTLSTRPGLLLGTLLCVGWLAEILLTSLHRFASLFVISSSFVLVLLSISTVNRLLFREAVSLGKNPVFLICAAFILYFTLSALTETFWFFGIQQSQAFRVQVVTLFNWINLLTNLLYAVAILWMPMRRDYLLPC